MLLVTEKGEKADIYGDSLLKAEDFLVEVLVVKIFLKIKILVEDLGSKYKLCFLKERTYAEKSKVNYFKVQCPTWSLLTVGGGAPP